MEIVKIDKRLCEGQNGNYHYEIGPQLHYRSFHSSYTQTFRLSNHICESVDHAARLLCAKLSWASFLHFGNNWRVKKKKRKKRST